MIQPFLFVALFLETSLILELLCVLHAYRVRVVKLEAVGECAQTEVEDSRRLNQTLAGIIMELERERETMQNGFALSEEAPHA